MKFLSKETQKLQKVFVESHLKDLRKLVGKCFLNLDVFEDGLDDESHNDGESNGGMEAILIHRITKQGSFIVTMASVIHKNDDKDDFADIAINEEIDAIVGNPCSRTEFDNVVNRAKALIEKKLGEVKGEKKG